MAFFAAARHLYLEEPEGESGYWGRLGAMSSRSLYIFGRKDPIISSDFGPKVEACLPKARVEVWPDSGHVPQLEHPQRTANAILSFLAEKTRARTSSKPA